MQTWIFYIAGATLLYGLMNFVYKMAAEIKLNTDFVLHISALTVALSAFLSHGLFINSNLVISNPWLLLFAFFNGLFFGLGRLTKFAALKNTPAAVVFPVNKLNAAFVIIIGFIFFNEQVTPGEGLGLICSLFVLGLVTVDENTFNIDFTSNYFIGIGFALLTALFGALSMTVGKLASTRVDKLGYIAFSYTLVAVFTFLLYKFKNDHYGAYRKLLKSKSHLLAGVAIGALNGLGYYLVLQAFARGPISLIQGIFGLSIIIPILLSIIFYNETLNLRRILALILAIVTVVLIG